MSVDPVSIAVTAALTAAQMALNATRKIEGPRLEDLSVTLAEYGTPIPYISGIRRIECPIIWAEEITETKVRRKTKGGKFNEYRYSATWAALVAGHEIDAVTKIWFDKHLIYDATGAGPLTPLGGNVSDNLRIYLGTTTQEPDPRMLATVEAAEGEGSCPAYRGTAYIVFEDIPLEKFGNRIPQITVEATDNSTDAFPNESFDTTVGMTYVSLAPDSSRFVVNDGSGNFEIWDMASRSRIVSGVLASTDQDDRVVISKTGSLYWVDDLGGLFGSDRLYSASSDGTGGASIGDTTTETIYLDLIEDGDGREHVIMYPYSTGQVLHTYTIGGLSGIVAETLDFISRSGCKDAYGDIWLVGAQNASDTVAYIRRIVNVSGRDVGTQHTFAATKGVGLPDTRVVHNEEESHFFIVHDGNWYTVDDETFAVKDSGVWGGGIVQYHAVSPDTNSVYALGSVTSREVSTATGATIRPFTMADWTSGNTNNGLYDPVNHALVSWNQATSKFVWRYLDRVGSDTVTLRSIVEDVCDRCGIESADVDATDLDQTITGYSWTQGPGKDIIGPLLDGYDSDARPHNFQIQFVKRGDSSLGTIDVGDFVRQGNEPRYKLTIRQDTDLPSAMTFSFADKDADQQTNSVYVKRPGAAVDGARELSIDMTTLVLTVDDARRLAERYFRRLWNGREGYELGLTAQKLSLEPADVYGLTLDGVSRTARNTKVTITGRENILRTEWERDAPILATLTSSSGAAMDGRRDETILVPVASKGLILDIPLIEDVDNGTNPIIYFGAAPYSDDGVWPGAVVYQSSDGTTFDEVDGVVSSSPQTWGSATDVLADVSSPWVWDRGNSVNVSLNYGTLTSATEAQCDADPLLNLALLGDELIQFATATLEADGTYTLTGLKRGRRGTEGETGGHAIGDRFVLLSGISNMEMGASDIGDELTFKVPSVGRDVAGALPIEVTYAANSHKPYAPVHLDARKDSGSSDWTITWARRTRVGGRWTGGSAIPLGETSEEYEVEILDGPGGSVVRTITANSETATYTSAQQVADGGDVAIGDLDIRVRQIGTGLSIDGRNAVGAF